MIKNKPTVTSNRTMIKQETKGFTVVELLIVIGVIVILAGMAIVAVSPGEKLAAARDNQRKAHIEVIYGATEQYVFLNSGVLPGSDNNCFDGKVAEQTFDAYECEIYLTPDILSEIPTDPTGGGIGETGYLLKKNNVGEVGVKAYYAEGGEEITAGTW